MKTQAYIGIDIGGTNFRVGAVLADGSLHSWRDALIRASDGPEAGLQRITALIEQVCADAGLWPAAIGIGSTGPVDRIRGAIMNPYTLPTWEDVDIVTPLSRRFGVPVVLENDADAAALGEAWMGAGRDMKRMLMVTVGTGIGTAVILNGQIYRGYADAHPEGGHIPLDPSGPECYCGARGCWESLAGGPAIGEYARTLVVQHPNSLLLQMVGNDIEKIDAALVADAARNNDPAALQVVERSATYLGLGLVNLLHLFLPDVILFSGGVMQSYDLYEATIKEVINQHSIISPLNKIPLRMAELGQQAGIFGAARSAMPGLQ